jgi:hypothetical protein
MAGRYSVNLPVELKKEAETLAKQQGVSLNQFILWSVAEKVSALKTGLDDPGFPGITYRRGTSGIPVPILRGTGIRVQTIVIAHQQWNESMAQIADPGDIPRQEFARLSRPARASDGLASFPGRASAISGTAFLDQSGARLSTVMGRSLSMQASGPKPGRPAGRAGSALLPIRRQDYSFWEKAVNPAPAAPPDPVDERRHASIHRYPPPGAVGPA